MSGNIIKHLDKDNMHHAYLIEGAREKIIPEVLKFCESINIKTIGNPDFYHITIDNFKMEEALDLRKMSSDKSFSSGKKIFILCVNGFSLDAENVLLKMFEEPIIDTHFFLIVPDINALLKTLVSRFYLISAKSDFTEEKKEAEKFISMSLPNRIDFIKGLLAEPEEEDEEGNDVVVLDSARSKALKFLNALEASLHGNFLKNSSSLLEPADCFEHIFKVREFLRMPGSSVKSLMESVALILPYSTDVGRL